MTDETPISRRTLLATGGVVLGGGALYAVTGPGGGGSTGGSLPSEPVPEVDVHPPRRGSDFGVDLAGTPVGGDSDALLDLYYWSEYQCPFCKQFENETLPSLLEEYVRPGAMRIAFFEFPVLGADSMPAAVMDACVWRQVRADDPQAWWRWHNAVFEQQSGSPDSGWADRSKLVEYTEQVAGVDADAATDCMDDNGDEVRAAVRDDVATARSYEFSGTPAFVLYDREAGVAGRLVGAQPFDRFETAIERIREA
jgi:protein-disulfide isomerase